MVKITFADGSSDNLVLNKYENMEGHFIGHLENEPDACVAMVNHPEHAELTIMSNRVVGSTMYKWHNDGNVELGNDNVNLHFLLKKLARKFRQF